MKRVAFFQRFFAHYQWGLVQELAEHAEHRYTFFGDVNDPARTGIEPIPANQRQLVDYQRARTWQPEIHLAFQPAAVRAALFQSFDCFILEGAFTYPTAWLAMLTARARRKRVLLYTHGWKHEDNNALIRAARLLFMRQANGLLLYGRRAKNIAQSLGVPSRNIYVVHNSLDYVSMTALRDAISADDSSSLKERLFGDHDLPLVIYVGRLVASKNVRFLLEACGAMLRQGRQVGLIIVGSGPEEELLKDVARQQELKVHFTGPLYDERELAPLFAAANVMVVPGATGLSAIHAMTYGTPVVTSDLWDLHGPEIEGIVPSYTGGFYRAGNLNSFMETLRPFVENKMARDLYSPSCRTVVDKYYNPRFMREVFDRAVSGLPASNDNLTIEVRSSTS